MAASSSAPSNRRSSLSKKVILLGHFGAGKSSLVKRFVHQRFSDEYHSTIGVKVDRKTVVAGDRSLSMILWDIEGGPDQSSWPRSYFLGTHGVLYVFDWTRPSTFEHLKSDLQRVQGFAPGAHVLALGNKADCLAEDRRRELLADPRRQFDFLTSAKSGENVEAAFQALGEMLLGTKASGAA